MNAFALSGLLTGLSSIAMGLFVLSRDRASRLNRLWCYFTLSVAVWGFGGMWIAIEDAAGAALLAWRLSFAFGVLWIPILFYHFVAAFCDLPARKEIAINYLIGLIFFPIILFSPAFYGDVRLVFSSFYYAKPGSFLFLVFFLWWLWLVFYAHYQVFQKYRHASGLKRNQFKYFFIAFSLAYGTGALDYLPLFGVDLYPYGNFGIAFYPIIMTYAIVKYRTLDITVVINRGLVYGVLLVSVFLPIYLGIVVGQRATIHALPPLLASTLIFSCGLWIAVKNPRATPNVTFSLVCLGVCIWLFGSFMTYSTKDPKEAVFWGKLIFVGLVGIPAFVYHFSISFLRRTIRPRLLWTNYAISAVFLGLIPTPYLVEGTYLFFWGHHPKAGPLHPLFLVYFFWVSAAGLANLYQEYRVKEKTNPIEAIRIKYVFWAFVIGYVATIDKIQLYGVEFYPTGYLWVTFWTMIVTYAIARYHVMDLSLIINRGKLRPYVQGLVLVGFYFLFLGIIRIVTGEMQYALAGILLAMVVPLAGIIRNAGKQVEKAIHQALFDRSDASYETLEEFSGMMLAVLDSRELTRSIVEALGQTFGVERISLFLQQGRGDYLLAASTHVESSRQEGSIRGETDRAFFSWLERQVGVVELQELEHGSGDRSILPGARRYFAHVDAEICLPLVHQRKLIGMINLGRKRRRVSYTQTDIEVLFRFRAAASVALANALAYQGVRQISQELEHEVEQRTHELAESKKEVEAAYRKLQELNGLKSQFFANISHEVRTPLTLILAPLQSLLARSALPEEVLRQLTVMYQNGLRLLRLINNLLDFAKIDAGKMGLTYGQADFIPFLKGIVASVSPLAEKKQIQLLSSGAEEPLLFYFDQDKIEKVLLNLIFNSLKFTPSGGQVVVSCRREGPTVRVAVSDTGIGIAEEHLPRLFNRFSQVDASASRRFEGTGLGLALAKDFVELHKGRIWAESETGRGTVMIFTLPFLTRDQEGTDSLENGAATGGKRVGAGDEIDWTRTLQRAAEYSSSGIIKEESPRPSPNGDHALPAGPTILLVEDNPDMLEFLGAQLQDSYRILTAADGVQGLEAARIQRPALILSDVMMPVMDGYQFCRELKSDPGTMHIPVILLTAKADLSMKIEGLEFGADEYLTKPFSSEELRARIKSLLSLRELEAGLIHSEKMAALGLLVAGVTHEINNPLHFSRLNLSNLRRAVERLHEKLIAMDVNRSGLQDLLDEIPDDVRIVNAGLERIERVVHDLKAFARKDSEQFVTTDLHEALESTLALLKGELRGRIEVVREYEEVPPVSAIPGQINQVFLNLLQNAIHAIPAECKGEIRVRTWREEEAVKIAIRDNGEGIRPENLRRIFDPFFTTKEVGKGTGLGLWICNRIMQKHGGGIEVNSKVGVGTEMRLILPLRQS